jgi:hypothetical protein
VQERFASAIEFFNINFIYFILWFRPEGRDTFLCSAKEKYPKETRLGCANGVGVLALSRVPFSLGTFSWASKRKYLAIYGEIQR